MSSSRTVKILIVVAASLAVHLFVVGGASVLGERLEQARPQKVRIKIQQKKIDVTPEPPKPELPEPKPEPIKPKPKPEPKKPKAPLANTATPKPSAEPPKPVQGLSKDSFAPGPGPGFKAPVGNTTMTGDEGKRLRPDQIAQLDRDQSEKARLIAASIHIPQYTAQAIDANLEGRYKVDVYVDATGKVVKADMPKKVGYQMDQRLIDAALEARFQPRKNEMGQPEAGWAEIIFNLQLP